MNTNTDINTYEIEGGIEVPPPAIVKRERPDRYGSVPGLDDSELANPHKLLQKVYYEMWKPILDLPKAVNDGRPRPTMDEQGNLDWGAFGTHDFEQLYENFDWRRSRREELQGELQHTQLMRELVMERVNPSLAWRIIRLVRQGVLDLDHITDENMRAVAKWDLRVQRARGELQSLWGQS